MLQNISPFGVEIHFLKLGGVFNFHEKVKISNFLGPIFLALKGELHLCKGSLSDKSKSLIFFLSPWP